MRRSDFPVWRSSRDVEVLQLSSPWSVYATCNGLWIGTQRLSNTPGRCEPALAVPAPTIQRAVACDSGLDSILLSLDLVVPRHLDSSSLGPVYALSWPGTVSILTDNSTALMSWSIAGAISAEVISFDAASVSLLAWLPNALWLDRTLTLTAVTSMAPHLTSASSLGVTVLLQSQPCSRVPIRLGPLPALVADVLPILRASFLLTQPVPVVVECEVSRPDLVRVQHLIQHVTHVDLELASSATVGPVTIIELICTIQSRRSGLARADASVWWLPTIWPDVGEVIVNTSALRRGSTGQAWIANDFTTANMRLDLTVSGATDLLFICRNFAICFAEGVVVTVGHIVLAQASLQHGGRVLAVRLPSQSAYCSNLECGEVELAIANPPIAGQPIAHVACPPLPTLEDRDSITAFGGCISTSSSTNGTGRHASHMTLYYTSECVGFEPPSARCVLEPHLSCAFGVGDTCQPCPRGAVCPGGSRAWPQRGFWTADVSQPRVLECMHPAARRCEGWDPVRGISLCGRGFAGDRCAACSRGYFVSVSLGCSRCPEGEPLWLTVQPYLLFAAAGTGVVVGVLVTVKVLDRVLRRDQPAGVKLVLEFGLWAVMLLQTVVQVTRPLTHDPTMPLELRQLCEALEVFELNPGVAIAGECLGAEPLLPFLVQLGLGICLPAVVLATMAHSATKSVSGMTFSLQLVLTPLITRTAASMFVCIPWDDERHLPATSDSPVAPRQALLAQPFVTCGEPLHLIAQPMSMVALALLIVVAPGATVWLGIVTLRRNLIAARQGPSKLSFSNPMTKKGWLSSRQVKGKRLVGVSNWNPFGSSELRANRFWWRQAFVLLSVLLGCTSAVVADVITWTWLSASVCIAVIIVLMLDSPFAPNHEWKLPLKAGSLAITALAVSISAVSSTAARFTMGWLLLILVCVLLGALVSASLFVMGIRLQPWRCVFCSVKRSNTVTRPRVTAKPSKRKSRVAGSRTSIQAHQVEFGALSTSRRLSRRAKQLRTARSSSAYRIVTTVRVSGK